MTVDEIARELEAWFPLQSAESWDNVGLLLGDADANANRVMTCLTITQETAAEAIREQANLIVSHHPIFFRPMKRLLVRGNEKAVYELARSGIAVYSPHTAFDNSTGGINEQLAHRCGLRDIRPLRSSEGKVAHRYKLVVFLTDADLEPVSRALFDAGAGGIGEYRECSFRLSGTGTFFGSEASHPTIGQAGRREEVAEHRLEVVVPADRLSEAVSAMKRAHSYEEPAFDIYMLAAEDRGPGSGRYGERETPICLAEFARLVQGSLNSRHVDYVGEADRMCQRVAVVCGSGADFLNDAAQNGCDVLLIGEARFHDCIAARDMGVALIVAGHYSTERFAVEMLADRIAKEFPNLTAWASQSESDPIVPLHGI